MAKKEYPVPNYRQRELLRRHGLDWHFYMVKRELNYNIFFVDRRDGSVKIIDKHC